MILETEPFKLGPPTHKGGATNLKVGGQCIGRWVVNAVKTLQFEKGVWGA